MAGSYIELLEATIQHLQELKDHGEKSIAINPEVLQQLCSPRRKPATKAPSKSVPQPQPIPAQPTAPAPAAMVPSAPLPPAQPVAEPVGNADKPAAMGELRERTLQCIKCPHLASTRKNVVFGVGDINSPLMFVGEAPGADEDAQGEPFVGAAGQLLTRIIKAMGYARESVYIANVLKCRPDTPGQAYGNRKPTAAEMQTCLPYLLEQIRLIQPKVIVALGSTAMEGLFGRAIPITKARGTWHTCSAIPVMPTFHPSYLLRNQAPAVKRQVWEDMLQVLEKLGAVISEKQRNYFKT